MATDPPTNDPHSPHHPGGVSQTTPNIRSRPSGAQSQNTQDAHQALDQAVDRILAVAKSPLEENKVPGVIKVLEKVCKSTPRSLIGVSESWTQLLAPGYSMSVRTRRRCFRGLVEVCRKYGILPESHTIPGSKISVIGDSHISSGEFSEVWKGEYKEDGETKCVAIKEVRYLDPNKPRNLKKVRRPELSLPQDRV